ncbi:MAG TPA: alpha/beta hydrolase [Flavisolibacter sp.]|jgi:pimeloyl-ACP methyl ester carboxylesterase
MEMFHIGEGQRKLASIFYQGEERKERSTGVIISNPLGHEYTRLHRTLSVLARELSQQGFHTFRYDYFGTGDSYGDETEMNVESSGADLRQVANELKEGFGIESLCLIGVRYGTVLSMMAAEEIKPDALVLWNPIFSGKEHIEEIAADEKTFYEGSFALPKKSGEHEYFGCRYSRQLIDSLNAFDIKGMKPPPSKNILVVADAEILQKQDMASLSFFSRGQLSVIENSVSRFWLKQKGDQDKSLVPLNEIRRITEWLVKST